jgi:hypothetical protein
MGDSQVADCPWDVPLKWALAVHLEYGLGFATQPVNEKGRFAQTTQNLLYDYDYSHQVEQHGLMTHGLTAKN